jgi:hypothetical protein
MRAAFLLLIPLTGCLDAVTGNVGNVPAPTAASVPREPSARRVFSTGLTAPAADKKTGSNRSFARGRVELKLRRDSTLEYHLNVYNPAAESFTAAHIYRSGSSSTPVVTLFAGTSLRDKYIQVRGHRRPYGSRSSPTPRGASREPRRVLRLAAHDART